MGLDVQKVAHNRVVHVLPTRPVLIRHAGGANRRLGPGGRRAARREGPGGGGPGRARGPGGHVAL